MSQFMATVRAATVQDILNWLRSSLLSAKAWFRIFLVVLAACVIGVAISATMHETELRDRKARDAYYDDPHFMNFAPKDLPQLGLNATLKTEYGKDESRYVFRVEPTSDAMKARLNEVLTKRSLASINFYISLVDGHGFQLCQTKVQWHRQIDGSGQAAALSSEGSFKDCPFDTYVSTHGWKIGWNYPATTESLGSSQSSRTTGIVAKPNRTLNDTVIGNMPDHDVLTGADGINGIIETAGGHTFTMPREAEFESVWSWLSGDRLAITCEGKSCLIRDEDHSGVVHGRAVR